MSAARAIVRHLHDWIGPLPHALSHASQASPEVSAALPVFSMGVFSNGVAYDVPEGIVFSFPCRRARGSHPHRHDTRSHGHNRDHVHALIDYEIIDSYHLTDEQKKALGLSIDELLMEKSMAFHNVHETTTGKIAQELNI